MSNQLQEMRQRQQQNVTVGDKDSNHPVKSKLMLLDKRKDMLGAGASSSLVVEREIRTAAIMLANSKDLQAASPESFYTAISIAINSGIGLARGMGYLVAYNGVCNFVPGWRGLVDQVSRTGRATVWTGVVHKGDDFDYALGGEPFLTHRPGDVEDHKHITHYYAIGRVKGSEWPLIEVWTPGRVQRHLTQFNKVGKRHYALKDDNNMEQYARKVVLLQVIKYLPQSQDVANAVLADAAHESGKQLIIDGDFAYLPDDMPGSDDWHEPMPQGETQQQQPAAQAAQAQQQPVQQQQRREETEEEADYRRSQESLAQQQPAATEATAPARRTRNRTVAPD